MNQYLNEFSLLLEACKRYKESKSSVEELQGYVNIVIRSITSVEDNKLRDFF